MDLKKAVKISVENEVKGRSMYIEFMERAKNPVTKATFKFLSDEELRHIEKIKEIAESLKGNFVVPSLEPTSIKKMKEIFGVSVKEFGKNARADSKDIEAHELAMNFEKKSYEFYGKLSTDSSDISVKAFFEAIKNEEEDHYEFIEKALSYIKNPAGFYADEEGWLLEG